MKVWDDKFNLVKEFNEDYFVSDAIYIPEVFIFVNCNKVSLFNMWNGL